MSDRPTCPRCLRPRYTEADFARYSSDESLRPLCCWNDSDCVSASRKGLPLEWQRFLSGHWTKEPPPVPGRYPWVSRYGHAAGNGVANVIEDWGVMLDTVAGGNPVTAFEGWWWSEPLPDLPKPPKWE